MFCFLFFYSFTWSIFNDLFLCGWTFLPLVLCAVVCSCCGGLKGVDVLEVKFINFNYVCVCVCLDVCRQECRCPQRSEVSEPHRIATIGGCELMCTGKHQESFLTTELLLQIPSFVLFCFEDRFL